MIFTKKNNHGLGFRGDFGRSFGAFNIDQIYTIPLGVNYIFGKDKNGLIIGFNNVFAIDGESKGEKYDNFKSFMFSEDLGYRYLLKDNRFSFQATYTLLFNTTEGSIPSG